MQFAFKYSAVCAVRRPRDGPHSTLALNGFPTAVVISSTLRRHMHASEAVLQGRVPRCVPPTMKLLRRSLSFASRSF